MPTVAALLPSLSSVPDIREVEVRGLAWDSRRVVPGDLFFALVGERADGHRFIPDAVARGAVAVVGERVRASAGVPYARVPDARSALAHAAAAFYGHPTRELRAIGVTGTNGKTTVVHLLGQLLPECETLTTVRVEREGLSCVTTPEAPDLQRLAAEARAAGRKAFAFEASSIGLAQRRVAGIHVAAAVFTGLGRDHLDFHRTMEAYLDAKLRLFRMLPLDGVGIVNAEDRHADRFLAACRGHGVRYGLDCGDVRAQGLRLDPTGAEFMLETPDGSEDMRLPFPGRHNVANALAAAATAWALGTPLPEIASRLMTATLPPGRFVQFPLRSGAMAVVDYAHNPPALAEILSSLRPHARRLVVVFGANGEADPGKRPLMGGIVGQLADLAVITTDNPKGEDPRTIAEGVARGVRAVGGRYRIELDRAEAIRWALGDVTTGDVVLLAGKGHERYQLTSQGAIPHSDLDLVLSESSRSTPRPQ
ncbi:MAG TPA: UDP-N-acetylmuramoyl-L-alanyl-D-glutamate--2,6-diaminopimelate ligase [Candidatus Bipolaricaulis sp.]|nr:UDP-N-acetylmuramoyl-L-alanyl-D-glutamate--2,6-diaminopimelate ligase [Candidatus Bipolaricaulis sp.]HRS14433.1 UDP-N-acetylmuramoyl-L-alanyl-D-glutamate--2,6-diaminopimelate ligase [Candidatus Bipolaricaulis sp.]HRU21251.1 UDP-N-acetylmuramoyl-L-alanyl-D-glutamate--2,6-diaminopimelate ligase [Candidatus Bipolaricaulis sp.]